MATLDQVVEEVSYSNNYELGDVFGSRRGRIERQLEELRNRAAAEGSTEGFQKGFEEGKREGFSQGYEDGLKQGLVEAPSIMRALDQIGSDVQNAIFEWFTRSTQDVAQLSVAIAKTIIGREVSLDEQVVLQMTSEAMNELRQATRARILVNPYEAEILARHRVRLESLLSQLKELEIVPDEQIDGGCRIETDAGAIDATLDRQLGTILSEIRRAA